MSRSRIKSLLSLLLIAGGAFLLFLGGRDLWEAYHGQSRAGKQFETHISPEERPSPGAPPTVQPLEPGDTVAKLIIPRLDAELYVVEGDGPSELRLGPGHLAGSAMPGQDGNCIIAGHRDTHFRVLKDIEEGDDIVLQTRQGQFLYRVKSTKIVTPTNTSALQPTSDAELNLITCYPFYYVGSAPKRFVVEAQLAGAVSRAS